MDGYKCKNVFRSQKHKKATRNPAGISVFIKNNIAQFVKFVKVTAEDLIWLCISKTLTGYDRDVYCCCTYIPPIGSPYYKNNTELNLFDLLCDDLATFSRRGHVMVTGDLNARIGLLSETLTENDFNSHLDDISNVNNVWAPPRCSIDTRTNTWGHKLIDVCTAHNMCLLNGRKMGDLDGRFTYFGQYSSAIDITIVDRELFSHTLAFKVHELTEYSEHCKIETVFACKSRDTTEDDSTVDPLSFVKYVWNSSTSPDKLCTALSSHEFDQLKSKIVNTTYEHSLTGCNNLSDDVEKLQTFLHEKCCDKINVGKKSRAKAKRQKWFTPDCSSLRKRVRRAANFLCRNPFNRFARDDYFSLKHRYNKLLKKSKKSHRQNDLNRLVNAIDPKDMWSILKYMKAPKSSASLPMNELYDHFKSVLNDAPKNVAESKLRSLEAKIAEFVKITHILPQKIVSPALPSPAMNSTS